MMRQESLIGAPVELSAPDGRIFLFHVEAVEKYAGESYAVLSHDEEKDQFLVTWFHDDPEGRVAFHVVQEEDILSAVLNKFLDHRVQQSLAREPLPDLPDEETER